jgi:D-cysteine desulfhydrase
MKQKKLILALTMGFVYLGAGSDYAQARPLEKKYPGFGEQVSRLSLIPEETPLQAWSELEHYLLLQGAASGLRGNLWIKRDDLSHQPMGGNKARKLEYLIGEALHEGVTNIETFGAWGSNHAYATTLAARQNNINVNLHLGPQPVTASVKKKLLADFALGATLHFHSTRVGLGLAILKSMVKSKIDKSTSYIPPGGSNQLGTLGYVDAMLELIEQFKQRNLPLPAEIIVPMGTAGTSAGMLVGACLAGVLDQVTIVAVGISHDFLSNEQLVRKVAKKTHQFLARKITRNQRRSMPVCDYDKTRALEYINYTYPAYGAASPRTQFALDLAKNNLNLILDGTYSGKAFAHLLDRLYVDFQLTKAWKSRLFWMTYNSYPLEEIIKSYAWSNPDKPWLDLPEGFHRLFESSGSLTQQ